MNRTIVNTLLFALPLFSANAFAAAEIHATASPACTEKVNVFAAKSDVYINGSGLPNGNYFVRVTEPGGGDVLGFSVTANLVVSGGGFSCVRLDTLVFQAAAFVVPGWGDTPNPAPNHRVEISTDQTFPANNTKHDLFKVIVGDINPPSAELTVNKFYDANVNGINDDLQPIAGWEVRIQAGLIDLIRYTPVTNTLDPDTYTVTESAPVESNWIRTTPSPVIVTLADGDEKTVVFGNVCTGAGGGKSHGFWGNPNGKAQINDAPNGAVPEMALLAGLNLRTAAGGNFDPTTYDQFKTWNGSATAVNMAYMLSVQMTANVLAIDANFVNGAQLVYGPGLLPYTIPGLSATGFISVNDLITAANNALGANGATFAGSPDRAYQEALKNLLDKLANNQSFVQATPCPFTFATL
jgi:hypothetical protein